LPALSLHRGTTNETSQDSTQDFWPSEAP
jgi:hypothetical protein